MSVKKFTNLEDFKGGSNKKNQLTPRSLEALKRQGITLDELRFISMKELKKRSDAKGVPNDILRLRWTHYEERRAEKLLICRRERQRIMQEYGETNPEFIHISNDAPVGNSHLRVMSAKPSKHITLDGDSEMIRKEREALERIKRKQQKEIDQKLLYEQQLQQIQERNEQKLTLQRLKEAQKQKETLKKQKERERKRKHEEERK